MKENKIELSKKVKGLILVGLMVIGFLTGFMVSVVKNGAKAEPVPIMYSVNASEEEMKHMVIDYQEMYNQKGMDKVIYGVYYQQLGDYEIFKVDDEYADELLPSGSIRYVNGELMQRIWI